MRNCQVCGHNDWEKYVYTNTNRIMTGDQRIGEGNLFKDICNVCGTIANKNQFSEKELSLLYGEAYELNTLGREEHMFFTQEGSVSRSKVFADWVVPHIPLSAEKIIEIGCGEGLLLGKLKNERPKQHFKGYDGSIKATGLAKQKGLNVEQKLITGKEADIENADVFMLINVIEHVEDINLFIHILKQKLNNDGTIIFCMPIQDYGGYDIFFAEHVWHFTANNFITLLKKNNLNVIHSETQHPINHGIGLFVCKINKDVLAEEKILSAKEEMIRLRNNWQNKFTNFDKWIAQQSFKNIAVFGSGEVFTLFFTFTSLGDQHIVVCIDETKGKQGTLKHNILIEGTDWLVKNKVDVIIMATNPKYYDALVNKLRKYHIPVEPMVRDEN